MNLAALRQEYQILLRKYDELNEELIDLVERHEERLAKAIHALRPFAEAIGNNLVDRSDKDYLRAYEVYKELVL